MAYQSSLTNSQNSLDNPSWLADDSNQGLKNPLQLAESAPVRHADFLRLLVSMGGMEWLCNSLRVKAIRRLVAVLNVLPTRLRTGFLDQLGANTMARTKRTRARFTFSAYTFARRFFGPVASFRIASMGGK
ncbi:MAG: hypothetical protein PHV02_16070 [Rhodocyclaceae bacterium]|nr:hypothetical protein [Rhodocyclaceae bacterium]